MPSCRIALPRSRTVPWLRTPRTNTATATHYFGIDHDPDLADLAAIADHYPVFRIRRADPS